MTEKNKNWEKAWTRLPSGRLRHVSGAEFIVDPGDGFIDIDVCEILRRSNVCPVHAEMARRWRVMHFLQYLLSRHCWYANAVLVDQTLPPDNVAKQ